jgi:hypothetical protein
MDRLERYRKVIRQVLEEYAAQKPANGEIACELIVDPEKDHYELLHVGWDRGERVHGTIIHIDIIDGKVWIQYDGTGLAPARAAAPHRLRRGLRGMLRAPINCCGTRRYVGKLRRPARGGRGW